MIPRTPDSSDSAWIASVNKRSTAAIIGTVTTMRNMEGRMAEVPITIITDKSRNEVEELARATHGGNYTGSPGPFHFDNRVARDYIRHNLTNYENLWRIENRGKTGEAAYRILRERVDRLIDEAYPEYRDEKNVNTRSNALGITRSEVNATDEERPMAWTDTSLHLPKTCLSNANRARPSRGFLP